MKTEDGINVKTGALIWYVNYFGEIKPIIFNIKGKSTVKYFALHENAEAWLRKAEEKLKNNPKLRLSNIIKQNI
jgi:hypothetical protein